METQIFKSNPTKNSEKKFTLKFGPSNRFKLVLITTGCEFPSNSKGKPQQSPARTPNIVPENVNKET